jgi:hypothetical protein
MCRESQVTDHLDPTVLTCMQSLAKWLDVPQTLLAEWEAIAMLEEALPFARASRTHHSAPSASTVNAENTAARAFLKLHKCCDQQHALYSAQLMHALRVPALSLRQLQWASSAIALSPAKDGSEQRLQVRTAFTVALCLAKC